MAAWLLNLGFAGGSKDPDHHPNWIHVKPVRDTFYVVADSPNTKMRQTVYHDKDSTTKVTVDFTDWLGGANISSITWSTEPTGIITVGNQSNSTKTATGYLTGGQYNDDFILECKCTTDDSVARVYCYAIDLRVCRTP